MNVFEKLNVDKDQLVLIKITQDNIALYCDALNDLKACMGDEIIQKCVNLEVFEKLSFGRYARIFLVEFLASKLVCDKKYRC